MAQKPPYELPPEMAQKVKSAAHDIMKLAPAMVDNNSNMAVATLCLAASTAAAWARLPYKEFVELISTWYEAALVEEAEMELRDMGEIVGVFRPGGPKN